MVEIKCDRWTLMDTWTHLERQMKIKRQAFHGVSSSRETWRNLSDSSSIEKMWFKRNDLHPSIPSEPLIEDETPNPMVMPKFTYLYTCSSTKSVLLDVLSKLFK